MRALYAALLDMASTAPRKAITWYERHAWIEDHPGWTFADYDQAAAGDILRHDDYLKMRREAEKRALDKARAEHGD